MPLDESSRDDVTVAVRASGARHPECGAIPQGSGLIRQHNDVRQGPGRRWQKPASVVIGGGGPRWYCVEVEPRAERSVVAQIRALGIGALAPEYLGRQKVRQVVRGVARLVEQDVLLPAFPRYVFAEFDAEAHGWRKIATRRGVKRLMGGDPERPQAVSAVQMAWVIGQFGEDGAQRAPAKPMAPLVVGWMVRVVAGPLEGHVARVLRSNGRTVSVEWAGRPTTMAQAVVAVVAGA